MSGCLQNRSVTIVGAGVAGLTAALALAAKGVHVAVYERAPVIQELGAGLQLSPNAMLVLDALGLGEEIREASFPSLRVRLQDFRGQRVANLNLLRYQQNGDFRLIHRARLIQCLLEATHSAGIRVETGQEVYTRPEGDLIIGADGLRSNIRAALNGPETPFFTGQTAWRAIVPDETSTNQAEVLVFMGAGRHLVSYPLTGGLRNIVAVQERDDWQAEGWSHEDSPEHLRAAFAEFATPVQNWLASIERTHIWGLFRHEVARTWQDGRSVLIGDAAHPTLPFIAQGAAMAIEDAWILASCLESEPDQATALSWFEHLRRPRVTRIVAASTGNARNYHLTGIRRSIAHNALRVVDRIAPEFLMSRFDWLYGFDPTAPLPLR